MKKQGEAMIRIKKLGFPWETSDPFLFCVHHDDAYPFGNEQLGPAASLAGRDLGQDFEVRDGWRMYHGDVVPGFPQHPHRGFETVTVAAFAEQPRRGRDSALFQPLDAAIGVTGKSPLGARVYGGVARPVF